MFSGGTAIFQETGERVTNEPTDLAASTMKVRVAAPPERERCLLFYKIWISKGQNDEFGPSSVHSIFLFLSSLCRRAHSEQQFFLFVFVLRLSALPHHEQKKDKKKEEEEEVVGCALLRVFNFSISALVLVTVTVLHSPFPCHRLVVCTCSVFHRARAASRLP